MPDNNGNLIVVRGEPNPVKLIKKNYWDLRFHTKNQNFL